MTLLSTTLLALGIAAGPASAKAGSRPKAFEELPRAPVEIVLPAPPEKGSPPVRPPAPAQPKPAGRPRIVISPPSLAKPPAAVPLPPPPILPAPTAAPAAASAAPAAEPKGAEVVASTSSVGLPLEQQSGYELVAQKCGRCHSVEKALHAHFTAEDWDAYLKKKFRRNGAGISPQQAEEIGAFLRDWAVRGGRP